MGARRGGDARYYIVSGQRRVDTRTHEAGGRRQLIGLWSRLVALRNGPKSHTHEHNRHNSGCHDAGRLGMEFFRLPSGRSQQTTLCAAFGRPLLALARAGQLAEGWPEAGQRLDKKRYDLCRQLARHQLFAGRALPPRQTFFKAASRGRPKRITTPRFLPGAEGFRSPRPSLHGRPSRRRRPASNQANRELRRPICGAMINGRLCARARAQVRRLSRRGASSSR